MAHKELNEKELQEVDGGGVLYDRREAVRRQVKEGSIQCKHCGEKEKDMFQILEYHYDGVDLYCDLCKHKELYKYKDISIG